MDSFNATGILQYAQGSHMDTVQAAVLVNTAVQTIQSIAETTGPPVTKEAVSSAIREGINQAVSRMMLRTDLTLEQQSTLARERDVLIPAIEAEAGRLFPSTHDLPQVGIEESNKDGMKMLRYTFNDVARNRYFGGEDPYKTITSGMEAMSLINDAEPGWDIITKMCANIEIAVELGKQMRPGDILNLYIASKAFRDAINGYMLSSIRIWIAHRCPEAGHIFPFKLYKSQLVPDPKERRWSYMFNNAPENMDASHLQKIRTVPGLRYMQLVLGRDRYCSEIIAIMARTGHLMPKTMHGTLLRLWLLMDVGYTHQRTAMLRNEKLWTDTDLYNAQFLFIKLGLRFNDPIYGPKSYELLHLMMGQRGLYLLWQLLMRKRFLHLNELVVTKVEYDFELTGEGWAEALKHGEHLHGVPLRKVGKGHLEGWGESESQRHLMRPDELVPLAAVERGLHLDDHLREMLIWGHIDWQTGENIVPTEEEMYIADEETVLAHMDTRHHWKKRHTMKKRWHTLTPEQQETIKAEDKDEELRALAYCGDVEDDSDVYSENEDASDADARSESEYSLNEEIKRGFVLPPAEEVRAQVPGSDDVPGWSRFINNQLIGMDPEVSEDDVLRMQATNIEYDLTFSWKEWMREVGYKVESEEEDDEPRKWTGTWSDTEGEDD